MSEMTPLSAQAQIAYDVLQEILRLMEFPGPITVTVDETDEQITLAMHSDQPLGLLIGKGGTTLSSLEMLVTLITRNKTGEYGKRLVVDAEQYRQKQNARVEEVARAAAEQVLESGENLVMEPMNSHDRRIIHMVIADIPGVKSVSVGKEPYRHLVICLPGQEPEEEE